MANIHRIQWIDRKIREGAFPNCRKIREEFEISHRQAARDIEYMRYSLNAPLGFSRKKNGFYYEDDSFMLPAFFLTREEKMGLSYLSKRYATVKNNKTAAILSSLFSKLSDDFEDESGSDEIRVANISENEFDVFESLKNAISTKRKTVLEYMNANFERSRRTVHPYSLYIKNGNSFLEGFCEVRNEIRIFRLDRILSCEICDEVYSVSSEYSSEGMGIKKGKQPFKAAVFFEKEPGKLDFAGYKIQNGLCHIEFFNSDSILDTLAGTGVRFRIISPNWLRLKLTARLHDLLCYNEIDE